MHFNSHCWVRFIASSCQYTSVCCSDGSPVFASGALLPSESDAGDTTKSKGAINAVCDVSKLLRLLMVVKECWGWIDGLSSEEVLFTLHLIPLSERGVCGIKYPARLQSHSQKGVATNIRAISKRECKLRPYYCSVFSCINQNNTWQEIT